MIALCDTGRRPFWPLYLKDVLGASILTGLVVVGLIMVGMKEPSRNERKT